MTDMRIVFMGTPDFATGVLESMVKNNCQVVGVITAPDRPAGRGQQVKISSVKEFALAKALPLLQPVNLKDEAFLKELKLLNADLQVVVAFRMLPEAVWKMPKMGTFNLHASLLPDYRGAAPINWAIINGETKTGVTTFFIDDKIDTGAIILQKETEISSDQNAGVLHDILMRLGAEAVIETLQKIASGNMQTVPQLEPIIQKNAPKLTKENSRIDWHKSGNEISNQIRGLSPYPGAWCNFINEGEEMFVKIYEASFSAEKLDADSLKIVIDRKQLKIALPDGHLNVHSVQLPGKKKMVVGALLNGMTFDANAFAG